MRITRREQQIRRYERKADAEREADKWNAFYNDRSKYARVNHSPISNKYFIAVQDHNQYGITIGWLR